MQSYRVVAIGDRIADAVRRTLRSPGYGHHAHAEVAAGYGPCRQCLKAFAIGDERRILFTYDSFHGRESFPLPGPVFNGVIEPELQRLLDDREVAYIHVRDTDAGCYDFSIERTSNQEDIAESRKSDGGHSHE